eukprot:1150009-Pelagomonas_calceolata.AAC.1
MAGALPCLVQYSYRDSFLRDNKMLISPCTVASRGAVLLGAAVRQGSFNPILDLQDPTKQPWIWLLTALFT